MSCLSCRELIVLPAHQNLHLPEYMQNGTTRLSRYTCTSTKTARPTSLRHGSYLSRRTPPLSSSMVFIPCLRRLRRIHRVQYDTLETSIRSLVGVKLISRLYLHTYIAPMLGVVSSVQLPDAPAPALSPLAAVLCVHLLPAWTNGLACAMRNVYPRCATSALRHDWIRGSVQCQVSSQRR